MFLSTRVDELRERLEKYILGTLITDDQLAFDIGIGIRTLKRFLNKEPTIRKGTLSKIGKFVMNNYKE